MGNQASRAGLGPGGDNLVGDLPDMVYKDSLGAGRLFKTSLCLHDEGGLVAVKTYARRPDFQDVQRYEDALIQIRAVLASIPSPHVWPTQRLYQSERAVHLVRQYLWSSLASRATSRPFLSTAEKRWLGYQLLEGIAQAHDAGVCHGDIKAENVLLTSWGWVFLVDFAPYKPVALPADNPADFSTFFYAGGRRRCYLAPERFYDSGTSSITPPLDALTPAMDIFAAGCVLAELFADGQPLFDYSQLLAYRQGTYDPTPAISALDAGVGAVVACMTQHDPSARSSARECLAMFAKEVSGPALPTIIRPFASELLGLDPDKRAALVADRYKELADLLEGNDVSKESEGKQADTRASASSPTNTVAAAAIDLDSTAGLGISQPTRVGGLGARTVEQLHEDAVEMLKEAKAAAALLGTLTQRTGTGSGTGGSVAAQEDSKRFASAAIGASSRPAGRSKHPTAATSQEVQQQKPQTVNEGLVLLLTFICAVIRSCRCQRVRVQLIHHLRDCAMRCGDDESRLQRAVPQLVAAAVETQFPAVRCAALSALPCVLEWVRAVPPADARAFADYLLPSLSLLPADTEAAVQAGYARALGSLATQARLALEAAQSMSTGQQRATGTTVPTPEGHRVLEGGRPVGVKFDEEMGRLRQGLERAVHDLLVGSRPEPKLALLPQLHNLSGVLGRRDTADSLLPALLTLFNAREWEVRAALYAQLEGVCPALGPQGVTFLLPFLDRMMSDQEPSAVASAVNLLASLSSMKMMERRHMLAAVAKLRISVLGSDCTAVRAAAVAFIAAAAGAMPPAATRALLLPVVRPHMTLDPWLIGNSADIAAALPPIKFVVDSFAAAGTETEGSRDAQAEAPAPATSYSVMLDPQHLQRGSSWLSCALEQVDAGLSPQGATRVAELEKVGGGSAVKRLVDTAQRLVARPLMPGVPIQQERQPRTSLVPRMSSIRGQQSSLGAPSTNAVGAVVKSVAAHAAAWRPRGVLVAHLAEHKGRVTRLASIHTTPMFVSASEDGTATIWDCRRLERDLSFRPRGSYEGHAGSAVSAATSLLDSSSVATGSVDGEVHLWHVERALGPAVTTWRGEKHSQGSAVSDLGICGAHTIVVATRDAGVVGLDVRAAPWTNVWQLPHKPSYGAISRFHCDQDGTAWLVTGTTRGSMTLWDLRFLLPVNRWNHPTGAGVDALAVCGTAGDARIEAAGPVVFAAAGRNEVAAWDAVTSECKRVFRYTSPGMRALSSVPDALATASPELGGAADPLGRAKQLGTVELRSLAAKPPGVRSVFFTRGGGSLLTAGTDCAVRCWDCVKTEGSYVVISPPPSNNADGSGAGGGNAQHTLETDDVPEYRYLLHTIKGVGVVEEQCALPTQDNATESGPQREAQLAATRWRARAASLAHQQTVVDMACVKGYVEPLLATASLDGVIKVWR